MTRTSLPFVLTVWVSAATAQQVQLKTNGYTISLKQTDTLVYEETTLSQASKRFNVAESKMLHKYSVGYIVKANQTSSERTFFSPFYTTDDGSLQAPTSTLFLKPTSIIRFREKYSNLGIIEEHPVFRGYYYLYEVPMR